MRLWSIAAATALMLAGCSDAPPAEEEPEAFQELEATKETGLIRGVVVDETITPIAGAKVRLTPAGTETVSDKDGAFAFRDLEPGTYFLEASAAGHEGSQASVDVIAGVDKPPIVRIMLQTIALPDPFITPIQYTGFITLGASTPAIGFVFWAAALNDHPYEATHAVPANASWVQTEAVWEPNTELAKYLELESELTGPDVSSVRTVAGVSPLVHTYDETESAGADSHYYIMWVDAGDVPVGLVFDQKFEVFTHIFHHFLPDEGWVYVVDGEHALPGG